MAYRVADSKWVDFERRGVTTTLPNYVTAYAATHPQEDFAETFRFYVARRGRLRGLFAGFGREREGVVVYEKFLALHEVVRSLRGWQGGCDLHAEWELMAGYDGFAGREPAL